MLDVAIALVVEYLMGGRVRPFRVAASTLLAGYIRQAVVNQAVTSAAQSFVDKAKKAIPL